MLLISVGNLKRFDRQRDTVNQVLVKVVRVFNNVVCVYIGAVAFW